MDAPADPWGAMVATLQGRPVPALPVLPGRVHKAPPEHRDEVLAEWVRLNRRTASPTSSAWAWSTKRAQEVGR